MVKVYGIPNDGEKRYNPAQCLGCESHTVTGKPDPKHISTSYVDRQNENHMHAVALYLMYYNFARVHQTLKQTRDMAAGLETRKWEISDIVAMIDDYEQSN